MKEDVYSAPTSFRRLGFRRVRVDEIGRVVHDPGPFVLMIGRIVEIASEGRHLARSRGSMTVSGGGVEDGRVPLDDMAVLICNARGLTYSNGLMTELARRGVGVVLCGPNYLPVAWLWPLEGHHVQALRMRCQIEASKPLCKRLWQSIVRAKIVHQQNTLDLLEILGGDLKARWRGG